jgi:hypothetical protein
MRRRAASSAPGSVNGPDGSRATCRPPWVLHSWASWRALIQLIRNRFYWEKTPHGLSEAEWPYELITLTPPVAALAITA